MVVYLATGQSGCCVGWRMVFCKIHVAIKIVSDDIPNLPIAIWMLAQIVLMFLSCFNKVCHADNLSLYRLVFKALNGTTIQQLSKLFLHLVHNLCLTLVCTKNDGLVLRPAIGALSIHGRGIMNAEKESNEILKMSLRIL